MSQTFEKMESLGLSCELKIPLAYRGRRLDQFLSHAPIEILQNKSRSFLQRLIAEGSIRVNGKKVKSSYKIVGEEELSIHLPEAQSAPLIPEQLHFTILFEDSDILVLSKPPNLVVHPGCGHSTGTLVHGLLYHCDDLGGINGTLRPGIVHRLDKDTSGVMVVAKNDAAQQKLVQQFKKKTLTKTYLALVRGQLKRDKGAIISFIGRHPVHRKKMAVLSRGGREAVTHWRVLEIFSCYSLLEIRIETGRTHQIRVHMASQGHAVAGDTVYSRPKDEDLKFGINRQCLHAYNLTFNHPRTEKKLTIQAPLWPDFEETLSLLRKEGQGS